MKKLLFSLFAATAIAFFAGAACTSNSGTAENYTLTENTATLLVFTAEGIEGDMSLKDYLDGLKDQGDITYSIVDGMVTEINGSKNPADFSYCWMFYTDLTTYEGATYANPEWGTYEYGGKTLASCSNGVELTPVISGYTYAAVYQQF